MPNFYLVKSEPYVFSFADLVRDGRASWDGVRNFEARNNLRAMKQGDLLLFYHSNEGKEVVGVATVITTAYPDPTANPDNGGDWSVVDVAPVCALSKPVGLDAIRKEPRLRDINLLRRSRLSVVPITAAEFACILRMGETTLPQVPQAAPSRKKAAAKTTVAAPRRGARSLARGGAGKARGAASLLAALCVLAPLTLTASIAVAESAQVAGALDAAPLLDARLADLDDHAALLRGYYDTSSSASPVVVVLHQDRKSAKENADFKAQLARLSKQNLSQLRVIALADVDGYDFWPAKGFVKDALRPLRNQGATVLVDWRGSVRKLYGLSTGQSAVFVVGPSGELQALARGKLSTDDAKSLLQKISDLLPTPSLNH